MTSDIYTDAHLIVSAIRILEHRDKSAPSTNEVCELLGFSAEQVLRLCRKLHDLGAIESVDGAFGTRLFIKDHLQLENLPQTEKGPSLAQEVERFKSNKKGLDKQVESIHARQAERQKDLFNKLDHRLKKSLKEK